MYFLYNYLLVFLVYSQGCCEAEIEQELSGKPTKTVGSQIGVLDPISINFKL